jgi:CO dehydrogenase maturation factor
VLERQELVLVDLAAGVEFLGRASIQGIAALVVVVEPGSRSIETANNMARMAKDLGVGCVAAIANKIMDTSQIDIIKSELKDVAWLGNLRYSQSVQEADLRRTPVIRADAEIVEQLREAKSALTRLIFPGIGSEIEKLTTDFAD